MPQTPSREALRDALAHLIDEVAMLRAPLTRLPESLHAAPPRPGVPSLRQTYALIAARDEARRHALEAPPGTPWPDVSGVTVGDADQAPTTAVLDRVAEARQALLRAVDALPDARFAEAAPALFHALLEDTALLRTLAEHLHDARGLSSG